MIATDPPGFQIKAATESDVPIILLSFVKEKLARYERLSQEVVATEELLQETLFDKRRTAEVAIGYLETKPVGFVLFFHNYSTFLGKEVFTSRIYSWMKTTVGAGTVARYCCTWRDWQKSVAAVGSSGRCSTGISRPSISTRN